MWVRNRPSFDKCLGTSQYCRASGWFAVLVRTPLGITFPDETFDILDKLISLTKMYSQKISSAWKMHLTFGANGSHSVSLQELNSQADQMSKSYHKSGWVFSQKTCKSSTDCCVFFFQHIYISSNKCIISLWQLLKYCLDFRFYHILFNDL